MNKLDKDILDSLSETFAAMDQAVSALSMSIQMGIDKINELRHDAETVSVNEFMSVVQKKIIDDPLYDKDRDEYHIPILNDKIDIHRGSPNLPSSKKIDLMCNMIRDYKTITNSLGKPSVAQASTTEKSEYKIKKASEYIHRVCKTHPGLIDKGCTVIHYKGHEYTVKGCGILEETITPMVAYQGNRVVTLDDGSEVSPTWFRTLENFMQDVELPDGTIVPRFRPKDDPATPYPTNIAPVDSVRDFAIQDPPPGHHVDPSVVAHEIRVAPSEPKIEQVMAIPAGLVTWQGLKVDFSSDFLKNYIYPRQHTHFVDKPEAEKDDSIKQIIPYVMIRSGSRFAVFRRNKTAGEQRLKGNITIGVGGHVNVEDEFLRNLYGNPHVVRNVTNEWMIRDAMVRELNEEVPELCQQEFTPSLIGVLNWDGEEDNGVGKYHLGIVYQITINTPIEFQRKDQGLDFMGWWTGAELHRCTETGKFPGMKQGDDPVGMESWTRILVESGIVPESYR